jgi:beta-lactamase class A
MKYLSLLIAVISFSFMSISTFATMQEIKSIPLQVILEKLEKRFNGKIGVYAINTNNNQIIAYRAEERFPFQSTFKLIGVAYLLQKSNHDRSLLKERIYYTDNDLISWHPITGKHVKSGMTLEELSAAAITYSDNPAINLIIKKLGGSKFITDFAHSIGNNSFNLVHNEPNLNSNPNYQDDTVTPKDMAITVEKLTLGNILTKPLRAQLVTWMMNSTTSYKRMRAAAPVAWVVADKTGSGNYGVTNDIGIMWSPECKPIVLAIYTAGTKQEAKSRDDIVATTTELILNEFAKNDTCFKAIS